MNKSEVPSQADIETASSQYWGLHKNKEEEFLSSYNNLIFLQSGKKTSKHRKHRQVVGSIATAAKNLKFPSGMPLFFNMMNSDTNGYATVANFLRLYRFSALYLELDHLC